MYIWSSRYLQFGAADFGKGKRTLYRVRVPDKDTWEGRILYDVIILAAGRLEEEFQVHYSVETKAFIPIGDKMMGEYVLQVLEDVSCLRAKVLVTPSFTVPDDMRRRVDRVAIGGSTIMESLKSGIHALSSPTEKVLVIPSDVPLLCREAVEDFITRCEREDADIYYSFISKEDSESRYPNLRHTYVRLREGIFCGGSLMLFSPSILKECEKLFFSLSQARKNPLKMASILGLSIICRFLTGRLGIEDLERRISMLLGAKAVGVKTTYAEVGFNVDDLPLLKRAREEMGIEERN